MDTNGNIIGSGGNSSIASAVMDISSLNLGSSIPGFRKEAEDPRKLNHVLPNEEAPSKRNLLIFIVGGVTLLEIAAFRYLSYEPNFPFRIIVASTQLINGSEFLDQLHHV